MTHDEGEFILYYLIVNSKFKFLSDFKFLEVIGMLLIKDN